MYEKYIKRFLDFVLSLLALIILSPIIIVIAILIKIKLGSPVLFRQKRPGLKEEIFELYKFRSMTNKTNKQGQLLPDQERLTKFGRFLRSTSLDELPSLVNIVKGDMSIVGPRPLLIDYLPHYSEVQRKRHDVRPGLTGLAQASGRNALSWNERFSLDVDYVYNISFIRDFEIILITIKKVFFREGIEFDKNQSIYESLGKPSHETERTKK